MIQRFGQGAGHHALPDAGDVATERRYEELARLRSPLSRFRLGGAARFDDANQLVVMPLNSVAKMVER
jgi:hypothetical protein